MSIEAYRCDYARGDDGTRIFWQAFGRVDAGTPTLVCCDGIGCDGYAWKYLIKDFAGTHRIVHWQYRGHGRSDPPADLRRVTFDDLCGDLSAVLRAAGVERSIVMGHSMGVQVALEYHRRHTEAVQGLVLLCGSHGRPLDTFKDGKGGANAIFPWMLAGASAFPDAARRVWQALIASEAAFQAAIRLELNADFIRRDDFWPYLQHLANMDPRVFLGILRWASTHSAYDHLPNVRVPTLIVAGERDSFTPAHLSKAMHGRIPGSELLLIPAATHTAPIEMPELISLRFEKWLRTHFKPESKTPTAAIA